MKDGQPKHHRHSIRLKGYDYSQPGEYFITICTYHYKWLFGKIMDGVMRLNEYGEIVLNEWKKSAHIRAEIELGEYAIMPNHSHAIVSIIWIPDSRSTPKQCRGDRPVALSGEQKPIGPLIDPQRKNRLAH